MPDEAAIRDPAAAIRMMTDYESRLSPPFGVIERPLENEEVASGSWGFGWALDDSGVESATVSADGSPAAAALLHQAFPGVAEVYPDYPDAARPGFGFAVPQPAEGSARAHRRDRGKRRRQDPSPKEGRDPLSAESC